MTGIEILLEDTRIVCARHKSVLVTWWRETPTIAVVDMMSRTMDQHTEGRSREFDMIVLIEPGKGPDGPARKRLVASVRRAERVLRSIAFVYVGTGIEAIVMRPIITMVNRLSRIVLPQRVFSSVDDAVSWLVSRGRWKAEEQRELVGEVRRMRSEGGPL